MIIFMISLLLTALYLTSPSKRKVPSKPSEFSLTDYKKCMHDDGKNLTNSNQFARVKSSGASPVKKPSQAKIISFRKPEYGKVLPFRKPKK